jgi:hypothetical protein
VESPTDISLVAISDFRFILSYSRSALGSFGPVVILAVGKFGPVVSNFRTVVRNGRSVVGKDRPVACDFRAVVKTREFGEYLVRKVLLRY